MTFPAYLLTVNLVLSGLILSYALLLRRTGWFALKRGLLWLMVAGSAWLPLADLPDFQPEYVTGVIQRTEALLPLHLTHRVSHSEVLPASSAQRVTPMTTVAAFAVETVFVWVYGFGMLVMVFRFGWQVRAIRRLIRGGTRQSADGIHLIDSRAVWAPFSFFHYVVLNATLYTPDAQDQILRHERIHAQLGHSIDRLASELLRIILWMNPLVWWHGQLVQENLEYQVDRAVLEAGTDARTYQYNLLTVSLAANPIRLTNSFSRPELAHRIRMMNRRHSMGAGLLLLTLFSVVTGLLLVVWPATQHVLLDKPLNQFAVARGNQTYFVVVPTANAADLRSIRAIARQRNITFELAPTVLRDSQQRIRQISFGVRPVTPAQAAWTSLKAGTPYGTLPISPLGIRCDPATCTVLPVDQTFPLSLRQLALRESRVLIPVGRRLSKTTDRVSAANVQYGLYETYFLDDMIESSFYGLRAMLIRIQPDKRLDLYDEARNAVIIWNKHEISRADLQQIRVTEVMKLSVYKGDAAVARLGDERARSGLLVLSRHPNPAQAEAYAASRYLW